MTFQNALIAQRERIEELEETVRQLRELLAPPVLFPASLGLTRSQRKILSSILAHSPHPVSRDRLMMVVYDDMDAAPGSRIIEVWISRMKKKLAPAGVEIGNDYGLGYFLDKTSAEALRALMKGE